MRIYRTFDGEWERWFAWHPVRVWIPRGVVNLWLTHVMRQRRGIGMGSYYIYKEVKDA